MSNFAAVGTGDLAAVTADNGASWQAGSFTPPPGGGWIGIAAGNGVYVAISDVAAATSADGQNWTTNSLGVVSGTSIVFGNGLFCVVQNGNDGTFTSPDGVNWTTHPVALPLIGGNWRGLCAGPSGRLVVFAFGTTTAAYSDNGGASWTTTTAPNSNLWKTAWSGSVFCAVSETSLAAATSADGTGWTPQTIGDGRANSAGITFGNGVFCAVSINGGFSATSADGASWVGGAVIPGGMTLFGVGFTGTVFAVVQVGGTGTAESANGSVWTTGGVLPASGSWTGIMALPATPPLVKQPSAAFASTWRNVRFVLQTAPDARSVPTAQYDALNPASWFVTSDDGTKFTPLTVAQVDAGGTTYDVTVQEQLPSSLHHLTVGGTLVFSGVVTTLSFLIGGMVWQQVATPSLAAAQRRRTATDLANPTTYRSASAGIGGTLVVKGGDYATVHGPELVKKLIYRRLMTPRGGFFWMPEYGLGLLSSKDLINPNDLVKVRAEIERQCRLEPDVAAARASITVTPPGAPPGLGGGRTPTGDVVEVSATNRQGRGA